MGQLQDVNHLPQCQTDSAANGHEGVGSLIGIYGPAQGVLWILQGQMPGGTKWIWGGITGLQPPKYVLELPEHGALRRGLIQCQF